MTRLIDANALTDELIKGIEADKDKSIQTSFVKSVCMILCKAIDAQPTIEAEPQWIPCSERLPEVRQWVLCQCRAGIMDILRLTADGSWYNGYPHTEYMGGFVVAWMPLPKPYEVEQ